MKTILIAASVLALGACQTVPTSVHVDAGKALIAAEGTLDAAVIAADVAVKAHATTPTQDAAIAKLTAPCPNGPITLAVAQASCPVVGYLFLSRQAYAASDSTNWVTLTNNLLAVASALGALH